MSSRLTMRSHDQRVTYNRVATTQPCSSFVPLVSSSSLLLSFSVHGLLRPPRLPCIISPESCGFGRSITGQHACLGRPPLHLSSPSTPAYYTQAKFGRRPAHLRWVTTLTPSKVSVGLVDTGGKMRRHGSWVMRTGSWMGSDIQCVS